MPIARLPASPAPAALLALLLLAASPCPPGAAFPGEEPPPAAPREEEKEWFHLDKAVFEPFERRLPQGSRAALKVTLRSPYHAPLLVVVFPDGSSGYFHAEGRVGRTHDLSFRLDRRGGRHRVALAADSPWGIHYLARFFLMGTGPDGKDVDRDIDLPSADTVYASIDAGEKPLRLERVLFHRMNRFRRRQGVEELPWIECVARAARDQMPDIARHWEETRDPRTGVGRLVHLLPGMGPGGGDGPTIADRVRESLGWPLLVPRLPPGPPSRGRNRPNYVTESLTVPSDSLDRKFEQNLLRKSDHRAALLNPHLTHAAGAASWRYYGWTADTGIGPAPDRTAPPGPPPAGTRREVLTALVFVQVNDPAAEATLETERRTVRAALARASNPEKKAAAFRLLGRHALPEAPKLLAARTGDRRPVVAAGALDGLWLCAPDDARAATEPLELLVARALAGEEEARAAAPLSVLSLVEYDAATGRRAREAAETIAARGREALAAAEGRVAAGDRDGARTLFEAAAKRFDGFPAAEDARAALRALGPAPGER